MSDIVEEQIAAEGAAVRERRPDRKRRAELPATAGRPRGKRLWKPQTAGDGPLEQGYVSQEALLLWIYLYAL